MRRSQASDIGRPLDTLYQTASFTASSAAISNGVGAQTYHVSIHVTKACHIRFAGTPVALTTDFYMAIGTTRTFRINPGEKVAAIRATDDGVLHVSELEL